MTTLRIAMLGARGLPASYGGIERHVEEISAALVRLGHEVTVFCRPHYSSEPDGATYRGIYLRSLPGINTKHMDALTHTATATVSAIREDFDIIHYHGMGPGTLAGLARVARRSKVVLTIHGLDYERDKWGSGAKLAFRGSSWVGARSATGIVTVSKDLQSLVMERYGRPSTYIPNGVDVNVSTSQSDVLERLGLAYDDFLLSVGRLVPEKNQLALIKAFRQLACTEKLVIVGGSSNSDDYVRELREAARGDNRIVFTGFVYGADLAALYRSARLFVQPSLLEGMPLTLLEACAYGSPILASDLPVHIEVLGSGGPGRRLFNRNSSESLSTAIRAALSAAPGDKTHAKRFGSHVLSCYSWQTSARMLAEFYRELASSRQHRTAAIACQQLRQDSALRLPRIEGLSGVNAPEGGD